MALIVVRHKLLGIHELKKVLYELAYLARSWVNMTLALYRAQSKMKGLVNSFEASHQSLPFFLTERHSKGEPSCKLK